MTSSAQPSTDPSAAQASIPLVTVAIRSYGRLQQVIETVPLVLAQDYANFEIVIVEQSGDEARAKHRAELDDLAKDPRVRLLAFGRLGPARARNVAWEHARGEILIFLDDDDLPADTRWISAHVRNFEDPLCVAVSGRHVFEASDGARSKATWRERRQCLRYTFLKMPRGYMRHGEHIRGVTQVAGTNSSLRLEAIRRAGGWDITDDHDEDSFAFRFDQVKKPGEYFAFDPAAKILRRLDTEGGLGRRQESARKRLKSELEYSHLVVARYFPGRFFAAYPAYLVLALTRAYRDVRQVEHPTPRLDAMKDLAQGALPELRAVWSKMQG